MTDILRLRVSMSGSGVTGPGLATFYFGAAATSQSDDVHAFYDAIKGNIPSNVTFFVPAGGDIITQETGVLSGTWNEPGTGGSVAGTFAGDYVQGVGVRVVWRTTGIYRGRRVKGSTFLVPIGGALFGTTGLLDPATQAILVGAANTLVAAQPTMRIWSRPNDTAPATAGISSSIDSAEVPFSPSWLRSRRT